MRVKRALLSIVSAFTFLPTIVCAEWRDIDKNRLQLNLERCEYRLKVDALIANKNHTFYFPTADSSQVKTSRGTIEPSHISFSIPLDTLKTKSELRRIFTPRDSDLGALEAILTGAAPAAYKVDGIIPVEATIERRLHTATQHIFSLVVVAFTTKSTAVPPVKHSTAVFFMPDSAKIFLQEDCGDYDRINLLWNAIFGRGREEILGSGEIS